MAKHYLVTGGTGFLGAALVKRLLADGHAVRVLDNNSRGAPRRLADVEGAYEMVVADVRDSDAVTAAAKGVDGILHLAAVNGTEFFYSKPELVLDVAVRGMLAVLDACRRNDIADMVVASSSEVYQTPPVVPTDESAPLSVPDVLNPRYSYGGGKIASELLAVNYGRTGFDRMTIFRPHNVYGPDMGWEHVLPQFALRAAKAVAEQPEGTIEFPILGDGCQTRAFVHIDDFTDGLAKVVERGEHQNIYHIGTPEETTIAECARLVVRSFGRDVVIQPSEAPAGETSRRCPDITKLKTLGYAPRISLEEGLPSLVEWYAANAHLAPKAA
ncbi:dTDP-glucose 4,6-dehydratase [Caenispirillum salinarum AK4]|uniref:dTDP-glucose 4,6-dehydratase n=1 Tax=Caenispirillum salinarum AK4 TaxID=1238182 RepID=K9GLH6_9PROT|nr:NAD-dependent epimerase/dehydratase family protein [Caenispirillum salinarum]EKV25902.1 dTDP-glucose 4,6-dehydratase [Caenispirillum salinarum AK4]